MATNLTDKTFTTTYKDDFTDSSGFHRILFNSGRIVQARELTQAQTILQKQIERMGNNIFKEGAIVKAGGLIINNSYEFIKLNNTSNTIASPSALVGTTFASQDGQDVRVEVIEVVVGGANQDGGSNPDTLYVRYVKTSGATSSGSTIRMPNAVNINNGSVTLTTATTEATGTGIRASVNAGIFYVKGNFVFTEDQSKIISKYKDTFSGDIGFKVVEQIISSDDDISLFDNQGATPNISAPGADRYKISLSIATRAEVTGTDNFVYLATLREGSVTQRIDQNDPFNVPSKVVAERIKENSGDYVVKQFEAKFDTDSENTHLLLKLSDGIAVVDGFRITRNPSQIRVRKANGTDTIQNNQVPFSLGNFVDVTGDSGGNKGLPNIGTFERLTIKNGTNFKNGTIGTTRVRSVNENGANYRYHLFDTIMNAGQTFASARSFGTDSTNYTNITLDADGQASIKEPENNLLLYPLGTPRPSKLTDVSISRQKYASITVSSGAASLPNETGTDQTYDNVNDWIISKNDSDIYEGSISFTSGGVGQATANISLSPQPANGTYDILYYLKNSPGDIKNKVLTQVDSEASVITTDSDGFQVLRLDKPDGFNLIAVNLDSANGEDLTGRFIFDNGQRDNFYDHARLILKGGQSAPVGNVRVRYRHFNHTGDGDFFALSSYDSAALNGYQNIPTHTTRLGQKINLSDVLDFRPVKNNAAFAGGHSLVFGLPQPNDTVEIDTEFYIERANKLVLGANGIITFIKGDSGTALRGNFPEAPKGTMPLFNINMKGNTLNDSDVQIFPIQNRRFTMRDIGAIHERVERLEEAVTLTLLEINTKQFEVLDSSGINRTRSGFVADDFTDQFFTKAGDQEYRASIDPFIGQLHPQFYEENIKMLYDSAASSNVRRYGDNVYLTFDSAEYMDASKASTTVKLNPFDYAQYNGFLTLSPSSDEWRDVENVTGKVTDKGVRFSPNQQTLWNNHSWNWGGVPLEKLKLGNKTQAINGKYFKIISSEKISKVVNERVIDTVLLPFQRTKKIFFRATGLRPDTQHFAYYDKQPQVNFVREETFVRYATDPNDLGNKHKNAAAHPEGATILTSDASGKIEGSLFIQGARYRTGTREFAIIDVTEYTMEFAKSQSRATTNFTSLGTLDTVEQDIVNTRVITAGSVAVPRQFNSGSSDDDDGGSGFNVVNGVCVPDPFGAGEYSDRASCEVDARSSSFSDMFSNDNDWTVG